MCKQVSAYQSRCYLLHTNCSAPQNPISKRLEEGTVCRNTAIPISKATALIMLMLKREMLLDSSWHPKETFIFVTLIRISPALPWDCFLLFSPPCGGSAKTAEPPLRPLCQEQVLCVGGLQCTLALQHNHHLLFHPKQPGNSTWKDQSHTDRRDRNTACCLPWGALHWPWSERVRSCVQGYTILSFCPTPRCRQMLQLSPGGAELSKCPLALGQKEHSSGDAMG